MKHTFNSDRILLKCKLALKLHSSTKHADIWHSAVAKKYEPVYYTFVLIEYATKMVHILCNEMLQWHSKNAEKFRHNQRETTGSSSGSLQLRPFSKWEHLTKERRCSQRERIISFKNSSL